jgi:APA family basic amino acid/polyamine antiporter
MPAALARVHPRFRTPDVAILVFAVLALVFGLAGQFAWNATLAAIVRLSYYALTCAALLVLRRRRADPPGFWLPAGALIAPLAVAFCLWLLYTRPLSQAWILAAFVASGLPVFWGMRARRRDKRG